MDRRFYFASLASSSIEQVGYDTDRAILRIRFRNGHTYEYAGVPAVRVRSLILSKSIGAYFNRYIRDRYPTRYLG